MARGRMISKSLSTSEKRARLQTVAGRLAEFCQGLYPLMVVHSDDFGRHAGDPFTVKHVIDPTSRRSYDEFAQALQHLHDVGLIIWYDADGRKYFQIIDFDPHQPGLHKRTRSKIPEPPAVSATFWEIPSELNRTEQEEKRTEPAVPDPIPSDAWAGIVRALDVSEKNRKHWFEPCEQVEIDGERILVNAPSTTVASFIQQHFSQALSDAIAKAAPGMRVELVVGYARRRPA